MCSILLHMSSLFYVKKTLLGCPNLSFIMTTDNRSITRMIWLPLQIKNHNCFVEVMLSIVLSPDPNMQAKRKSIQQDLDLENEYNILETKKPMLKVPSMWESAMQGSVFNWRNNRHSSENSLMRPMIGGRMKQLNCYMHGYQRRQSIYIMLVIGTSKHKLNFMRRRL